MTGGIDELEVALLGRHIYQRAGQLVTPIRIPRNIVDGIGRSAGSCSLRVIDEHWLAEHATAAVNWVRYKKDEIIPQHAPMWAIRGILARGRWKELPLLCGHVLSPTLRRDGSVLSTSGYDAASGLLADFDDEAFPAVPDSPTGGDVDAAVAMLLEPFVDFPFAAESDRASAVALVLSILARQSIDGPVPIFAIRATTPGTGKTLIAHVAALIATGSPAPVLLTTADSEEETKRLLSIALAGDSVVLLDNLERALGHSALDAAVTSGSVRARMLGASQMVTAPWSAVVVATGNGLQVRGDTGRRTIPIDVDPNCEQPELRSGFAHDPLNEWVLAHRGELVCAALTLLRAHHLAGSPCPPDLVLGSFEAWSRRMRAAIVWAGLADPCEGQARLREYADPELTQWGVVLEAWAAYCGDKPKALATLLPELRAPTPIYGGDEAATLLSALEGLCRDSKISPRYLGKIFQFRAGRIIGGKRLVTCSTGRNGREWRVV